MLLNPYQQTTLLLDPLQQFMLLINTIIFKKKLLLLIIQRIPFPTFIDLLLSIIQKWNDICCYCYENLKQPLQIA
jgi:hypothetical protein